MIIISYATEGYKEYQAMLDRDCRRWKIEHRAYDDAWFHATQFYQDHRDIADQPRWAGYCIWKPYIILDALKSEEAVVYLDATSTIHSDPRDFVDAVEYVHTPKTGWINRQFCKRDAFFLMGCDSDRFWNARQVWAGSIVVKKRASWLIEDFERFCCDRRIVDNGPSECGLPELEGFGDTRGDQSVLSILAELYWEFVSTHLDGFPFTDRTGSHL